MIISRLSTIAAVLAGASLSASGTIGFAGQGGPRGGSAVPVLVDSVAVLAPAEKAPGSPPSEGEQIANRILKAGSDLFDAKNAAALAATYAEDGQIHVYSKSEEQQFKEDVKRGRADIEQFYRDLFRDSGPIDSENTVEVARLIAPDLLVIHGRFRPNTGQSEIPFVQMRVKQGPEWLIKELWLFLSPG